MSMRRLFVVLATLAVFAGLSYAADDLDRLKREFKAALERQDTEARVQIVQKMAAIETAEAVDTIVNYTFGDLEPRVYEEAVKALAGMREVVAVDKIVKMATSTSTKIEIRAGLTEVLAQMQGDRAEDALVALLSDRDSRILSPAARALGKRRSKKAIPGIIKALKEEEGEKDYIWGELRQALTDITGEDFTTAKEWEGWWAVAKAQFDPNTSRGKKDTATLVLDEPDFFTEKIASKKIVFVIDISGSMHLRDPIVGGEAGDDGSEPDLGEGQCTDPRCGETHKGATFPEDRKRIIRVKRELAKVVKGISESVQFNVICFSDKLLIWSDAGLVRASKAAKQDAMGFVTKFQEQGLTHTGEALEAAFKDKKANTIFLLSDGVPTRDMGGQVMQVPFDEILNKVKLLNRFRKVKIYTFGFAAMKYDPHEAPALDFMKKLAADNNGKFTPVP